MVAQRPLLQDAETEAMWQSVLAALTERVQAMDQEVAQDKIIYKRGDAARERNEQYRAMFSALTVACEGALAASPSFPNPATPLDEP